MGQLEEQGVAANMEEAAIRLQKPGVDDDMMSPAYMLCLGKLVKAEKYRKRLLIRKCIPGMMMKKSAGKKSVCRSWKE